jgi:hypothetical protein
VGAPTVFEMSAFSHLTQRPAADSYRKKGWLAVEPALTFEDLSGWLQRSPLDTRVVILFHYFPQVA